jgi:1-acyl-sn-glycerol-3-phosphate acyltransferase
MNRILLMVLRNIFVVPGAYMKLCHYAKNTDKYAEEEKYKHIQYILKLAVKSGNIDLKVTGTENIPQEDGFLMYGNHQGMFDIVAIAATCDKPLGAVLKKELAEIPFIKQIIACTNSFPMDREDIKQSMTVIVKVIEEVKKGRNYLIFPEGTRSKTGNHLLEFHGGSFKCALKAKCPIIPVAFVDSFKVLDQKGCKPVNVQIHYLEPIMYEEYKDMKTVELAELVKSRIKAVVEANS